MTKQERATAELKQLLAPGQTVYTTLRYKSHDGRTHHIDMLTIVDNQERIITPLVAKILDAKRTWRGALKAKGWNMDMGYYLTSRLAQALGYTTAGPDSPGNCYGLSHEWL